MHVALPPAAQSGPPPGPRSTPVARATRRSALLLSALFAPALLLAPSALAAPPQLRALGDATLVRGTLDLASTLAALPTQAEPSWLAPPTEAPFGDGGRQHHARQHEGARVIDQDVLLFVDPEGRTHRAIASLRPIQTVTHHTPAEPALALARQLHPGADVISTEPLWVPGDDGYEPVHSVTLGSPGGLPRTLWIDAVEPPALRRELAPLRSYEGSVQVYDTSVLHGPLVLRPVTDLEYETWLSSEDRVVVDREHDDPQPLQYSEDATFHWEPDDWRFSIAMGFYHLQQGEAFFVEHTNGLFEGFVDPDYAVVNIGTDNEFDDSSFARRAGHGHVESNSGWRHYYLLGIGTTLFSSFNNFAHDAEVWLHEEGHALTSEATPFNDGEIAEDDAEFHAIGEGLADYGAAAYTENAVILEYIAEEYPESHRDLTERRVFPDDFDPAGDEHPNGQILGSAAWALRELIGPEAADPVVLASRYFLTAGAHDFRALADGMVLVDEDAHAGRYAVPILETLLDHGIPAHPDSWPPYGDPTLASPPGEVGEPVRLIADTSDREGGIVGHAWSIVAAPADSAVQAVEGEERWDEDFSFVPDVEGTWTVALRVSDEGWQLSERRTIDVVVGEDGGDACACSDATRSGGPTAGALPALLLLGWARRRRRPAAPVD